MLIFVLIGLLVIAVSIFLVPLKAQYFVMLTGQLAAMILSGLAALLVFKNSTTLDIFLVNLLDNQVFLVIDPLSAFFILVINLTVFTGALYARGYLKPYEGVKSKKEMAWHYFHFFLMHISMLMVVMLREGISFLVFWELMSVATFFLILFESEKPETKAAAIKFFIQMHIAFYLIIIGFIVAGLTTGLPIGFESLGSYFKTFPVFPLFLLFFVGFGIKAGFIPLHSWLPHAHPAAPSHISGVMSGVMIKMGIYGIVRVLSYIHTDLLTIGIFLLLISAFSGIVGVVIAIVQHDIKKLLAYHSIENIGIIGMGIGIGVIGLAMNNNVLASLGFAGGLLHVLNHSLFKSLLFYSAGSVYQQTHSKNIEQLGGLMKKMPYTAILFLVGAVAISGLPPFNGFISEFLIYAGLFKSLHHNNLLLGFLLLGGIVALVVIGGLAMFCFTKVFSIVFLGHSRSEKTLQAHEVTNQMLFPKFLIAFIILAIGTLPFIILKPLGDVVGVFVKNTEAIGALTSTMTEISVAMGLLIGIIALVWVVRNYRKTPAKDIDSTWGCGYEYGEAGLNQYSATSYSEYIGKKAKIIVGVEKHFKPLSKEEIFPEAREFTTHSSDVFEDNLASKPTGKLLFIMEKMAIFQTGNIQHYLLYAIVFVVIIVGLTLLNFI